MEDISRRNFLKGAAIVGAASVVGAAAGCGSTSGNSSSAASTSTTTWDKESEVVVLGTGAGGLATAITAAQAGAQVLVLEKAKEEEAGGNTRVSGNMWTCPTDIDEGLKYYKAASERTEDDEYLTALATSAYSINDDFISKLPNMEVTELPIFSPEFKALPGGDAIQAYCNVGTGESQLWLSLYAGAQAESNIEFAFETPGKKLIVDADGCVIGVIAESGGKEINVKAKKGVVIATGGYEFNQSMIENSYPGWPAYSRGTPYNTGDGIIMAQKIGAALWHMNASDSGCGAVICKGLNFGNGAYNSDDVPANTSISVASKTSSAWIAVDKYGKRFMAEDRPDGHGYGKREYLFFYDGVKCEWPRLPFWAIVDGAFASSAPLCKGAKTERMSLFTWFAAYSGYQWSNDNSAEVQKGWILKGDTIEDLAKQMEVEAADLQATIDAYNSYVASGTDAEFGRAAETMTAINAPYFAMKVYPNQYNTQGGPKRNSKAQTLDSFGEVIPRLYNVGECGAGYGWVYNGGWNNCEAMVTGVWAGTDAAAAQSWE